MRAQSEDSRCPTSNVGGGAANQGPQGELNIPDGGGTFLRRDEWGGRLGTSITA